MNVFFKYYRHIIKARFMQLVEYKGDFIMTTMASYGYNILFIIFINLLFDNFDKIGDWTRYEGLLLLGYSQLVLYLYYSFFGSLDEFTILVKDGKLDQYLMRPINAFWAVVLDNPALVSMLSSIVLALIIIIVALVNSTFSTIMMFFSSVILFPISILLFTAFRAVTALLSFWVTDTTPIDQFYGQMLDNMKFPLEAFPRGLQLMFKTILPISLAVYVPVRFIYFGFDLNLFIYFIGCTLVFTWLTWYLWKTGLRSYSSASS